MEEELARTDAGEALVTGLLEQTEDQLQRPLKGYQVRWVPGQGATCQQGAHPHTDTPHRRVTQLVSPCSGGVRPQVPPCQLPRC